MNKIVGWTIHVATTWLKNNIRDSDWFDFMFIARSNTLAHIGTHTNIHIPVHTHILAHIDTHTNIHTY